MPARAHAFRRSQEPRGEWHPEVSGPLRGQSSCAEEPLMGGWNRVDGIDKRQRNRKKSFGEQVPTFDPRDRPRVPAAADMLGIPTEEPNGFAAMRLGGRHLDPAVGDMLCRPSLQALDQSRSGSLHPALALALRHRVGQGRGPDGLCDGQSKPVQACQRSDTGNAEDSSVLPDSAEPIAPVVTSSRRREQDCRHAGRRAAGSEPTRPAGPTHNAASSRRRFVPARAARSSFARKARILAPCSFAVRTARRRSRRTSSAAAPHARATNALRR